MKELIIVSVLLILEVSAIVVATQLLLHATVLIP